MPSFSVYQQHRHRRKYLTVDYHLSHGMGIFYLGAYLVQMTNNLLGLRVLSFSGEFLRGKKTVRNPDSFYFVAGRILSEVGGPCEVDHSAWPIANNTAVHACATHVGTPRVAYAHNRDLASTQQTSIRPCPEGGGSGHEVIHVRSLVGKPVSAVGAVQRGIQVAHDHLSPPPVQPPPPRTHLRRR